MKDPLDPQDPLWKLLGQGREVDVRPNFARSVVREARKTPQERGWVARLTAWFREAETVDWGRRLAVAAVVVMAASWGVMHVGSPSDGESGAVAEVAPPMEAQVVAVAPEIPLVPEVETQLETLDYLDALLALEDTSGLTDREIGYLLY